MPVKGQGLAGVTYYASDSSGGKTGDASNHTVRVVLDGTSTAVAATPVEVDSSNSPGLYRVTLTDAENDAEMVTLGGKSSTSGVTITPLSWSNIMQVDFIMPDVITASSIDQNAITENGIATDAISASQIADDAITSGSFASGSGTGLGTVDSNVTQVKGDSALTSSGGIKVGAMTTDVIGAAQIADGALTAAKLGADCITSDKIADDAIGAAQVAEDAITVSELSAAAATEIAQAVWDQATSGYTSAGTFGERVGVDVPAILVDTGTTMPADLYTINGNVSSILTDTSTTLDNKIDAIDDYIDTEIAAIKTVVDSNATKLDTIDGIVDDILTDTGTTLDSKVDAIDNYIDTEVASIKSTVEGNSTKLDTIDGIVDDILVDTGTTLDGKLDTIDGIVDDILVDTGTTLDTKIGNVSGYVDTEVAAIKTVVDSNATKLDTIDGIVDDILVDTGTTLPSHVFTADLKRINGSTSGVSNLALMFDGTGYAGGTAKLQVDVAQINSSTTGVATLGLGASTVEIGEVAGTPTTTVIVSDTSALSAVNDNYNCRLMIATSGSLKGQVQEITDYVGATKTFTTTAWTSALADNDDFIIV